MRETHKSETMGMMSRAWRFLQKPTHEKATSLGFRWASLTSRWTKAVANLRLPVRLKFGAWWVPRNDTVGEPLLAGKFETHELAFVDRFLRPGMTVFDLGAHHGLYTLLASKRVGSTGRVISFEPSPRERKALSLHVLMNLCWNVTIQGLALGNENSETVLYVVEDWAAGCNSLRPPDVPAATSPIRVRVTRLDDWLDSQKISRVDFIKLDVEGAELDALKGAERLLDRKPRPVILAEVQDVRTQPWGYPAKEIIQHLSLRGYKWLRLTENGSLKWLEISADKFEGNFVAVPEERWDQVMEINHNGSSS
jgi:FkbM family methyltransferase